MARHVQALHSKFQPQNKEAMLSTVLGSPLGERVTDRCSLLVLDTVGFSQELLPS